MLLRSKDGEARGFTVMIVGKPGEPTRRVHVPRWAFVAVVAAWCVAMGGAGWLGFVAPSPEGAQGAAGSGRAAGASTGMTGAEVASASSSASRAASSSASETLRLIASDQK